MVTDATDPDLADLRRWVVDPVVSSLFNPRELDEVVVRWGDLPAGGEVRVRVVAGGERFEQLVVYRGSDATDPAVLAAAVQLANSLEDFVCETRFGCSVSDGGVVVEGSEDPVAGHPVAAVAGLEDVDG